MINSSESIIKQSEKAIAVIIGKYGCTDELLLDQGAMSKEDSFVYEQLRLVCDLARSQN